MTAVAAAALDRLGADYRFSDNAVFKKWYGLDHKDKAVLAEAVFGLPELYKEKIKKGQKEWRDANPEQVKLNNLKTKIKRKSRIPKFGQRGIKKFYKNKQELLNSVNESKLQSPIVLVDPTFKERNALAALSQETFLRFKESCAKFLRNPAPSGLRHHKLANLREDDIFP